MEKTRFGVSVSLVAAIACLLGYYSGYVITGVLVGYVLLMEDSQWLKRFCVKVLMLMLAFSVASTAIGLIPTLLGLLYDFLDVFGVNLYLSFIENVFALLGSFLGLVKTVTFLGLAFVGLSRKEIKVPFVDKFIEKHIA